MIIHQQVMMFINTSKTIIQRRKEELIVLDDMIADMESNKKSSLIFIEVLFEEERTILSLVSLSQSHFRVPKTKSKCSPLFYHESS